jgi:vesicular inhibitory amino acid transporter
LTLAIVFKQAALLLPAAAAADPVHLAAVVVLALLPLLALPSFRRLTPLSAIGCAATVAVAAAVGACVAVDPHRMHFGGGGRGTPPPPHALLRPAGLARSLGIFSVAVSGHSSLPALRSSLADPSLFPRVLDGAFLAMGLAYGATAATGYYYFGDAASPVITANLASDAPFSGRLSSLIPRAVGWAVLANAFSTYPSMVMVVQSTLWSLTPWARGEGASAGGGEGVDGWLCRPGVGAEEVALRRPKRGVRFSLRVLIAVATAGAAILAASSLGDAIALLGGLAALACSLILPTVCYWRVVLKERDDGGRGGVARRVGLVGLVVGGAGLMVLIVSQTASKGGGP